MSKKSLTNVVIYVLTTYQPHHDFPICRLQCYVLPCAVIVPPHVVNEIRRITIQERGSANKLPSVGPLLNMGNMFCHLVPLPFTLEGYPRKVGRHIHDKWNRLLHPKLIEDPLEMMPLHYQEVYQWHLDLPNMLTGCAIHRQGAQCMRVRLPYNLHKWIVSLVIM